MHLKRLELYGEIWGDDENSLDLEFFLSNLEVLKWGDKYGIWRILAALVKLAPNLQVLSI